LFEHPLAFQAKLGGGCGLALRRGLAGGAGGKQQRAGGSGKGGSWSFLSKRVVLAWADAGSLKVLRQADCSRLRGGGRTGVFFQAADGAESGNKVPPKPKKQPESAKRLFRLPAGVYNRLHSNNVSH